MKQEKKISKIHWMGDIMDGRKQNNEQREERTYRKQSCFGDSAAKQQCREHKHGSLLGCSERRLVIKTSRLEKQGHIRRRVRLMGAMCWSAVAMQWKGMNEGNMRMCVGILANQKIQRVSTK